MSHRAVSPFPLRRATCRGPPPQFEGALPGAAGLGSTPQVKMSTSSRLMTPRPAAAMISEVGTPSGDVSFRVGSSTPAATACCTWTARPAER
jgi:hypothetical protein